MQFSLRNTAKKGRRSVDHAIIEVDSKEQQREAADRLGGTVETLYGWISSASRSHGAGFKDGEQEMRGCEGRRL